MHSAARRHNYTQYRTVYRNLATRPCSIIRTGRSWACVLVVSYVRAYCPCLASLRAMPGRLRQPAGEYVHHRSSRNPRLPPQRLSAGDNLIKQNQKKEERKKTQHVVRVAERVPSPRLLRCPRLDSLSGGLTKTTTAQRSCSCFRPGQALQQASQGKGLFWLWKPLTGRQANIEPARRNVSVKGRHVAGHPLLNTPPMNNAQPHPQKHTHTQHTIPRQPRAWAEGQLA